MTLVYNKGLSSGEYIFLHLTFGAGLNHTGVKNQNIFSSLLEVGPISTQFSNFERDAKAVTKNFTPNIALSAQVSQY